MEPRLSSPASRRTLFPEMLTVRPTFFKDLRNGAIGLVSASPEGVQGNAVSFTGFDRAVSADGTKVLFNSSATNLIPGDGNSLGGVFVKNTKTGELTLASVAADGSLPDKGAGGYGISDDGTKVLMLSELTNLVGDASNGEVNVFVKDLATGGVLLANSSAAGAAPMLGASTPSMSADGSTVSSEPGPSPCSGWNLWVLRNAFADRSDHLPPRECLVRRFLG